MVGRAIHGRRVARTNGREGAPKRVGCVQPTAVQSGFTGLSGGAPDSVRCARLARAKWPRSGIHRRRTTIIHRTARCAPDCPVSQRSARANGRPRNPRGTRGRANGRKSAPDCPVCNGHVRCANSARSANGLRERESRARGLCLWPEPESLDLSSLGSLTKDSFSLSLITIPFPLGSISSGGKSLCEENGSDTN